MYRITTLVSTDNTFVLLKYIESIREVSIDDQVVDRLKDDITLAIKTVSGTEYIISMSTQIEIYKDHGATNSKVEMRNNIVDQWLRIANNQY